MQGLLPIEEMKVRLGLAERFSRRELAITLGAPMAPLSPVQITRDIQAIYGHRLDRRPIPYEVAIELYLVRLYRLQRIEIELAPQVSREEIKEFIDSFDSYESPIAAKWAWAERFGGGQRHFEQIVVAKVRGLRQNRLIPATYDVQAVAA